MIVLPHDLTSVGTPIEFHLDRPLTTVKLVAPRKPPSGESTATIDVRRAELEAFS